MFVLNTKWPFRDIFVLRYTWYLKGNETGFFLNISATKNLIFT